MNRSLFAVSAVITLLVCSAVHAETARLVYNKSSLSTEAGRAAVRGRIAQVAETYCRANPVGGTISACRRDIAGQLNRRLEVVAAQQSPTRAVAIPTKR